MRTKLWNLVRSYYPHILIVGFFLLKSLPILDRASIVSNQKFNYLDDQLFFEALHRFSHGEIIYKDFYWEYGLLYLLIGLPIFLIGGKTFYISNVIGYAVMPLLSALVAVCIGYLLFKKNRVYFFLFLLFELSYETAFLFPSLRHLIPELGLLLIILGVENKANRKVLAGFSLLGLSLISSLEYAAIGLIALVIYLLVKLITDRDALLEMRTVLLKGAAILVVISLPFFLFLSMHRSLGNYLTYLKQSADSFYAYSPCRDYFPRLRHLKTDPMSFVAQSSLYVVPVTLVFILIVIALDYKKTRSRRYVFLVPPILFACASYIRPLITPCAGYVSYGLTFVIAPILYIARDTFKKKTWYNWIVLLLIAWLLIPVPKKMLDIVLSVGKREKIEDSNYLPVVGLSLKKDVTDDFLAVTQFLTSNTTENDYVYTYPHGSYHILAGRRNPTRVDSSLHFELAPFLAPLVVKDLAEKQPEYIVLSGYNSWSYMTRILQLNYDIYNQDRDVFFMGYTSEVEDYIALNYKIAQKFKYAWVLEKKTPEEVVSTPKLFLEEKVVSSGKFTFSAEDIRANRVFIPMSNSNSDQSVSYRIRLRGDTDMGITKVLEKYIWTISILPDASSPNKKNILLFHNYLPAGDFEVLFNIPRLGKDYKMKGLFISISSNFGFLPFGTPDSLELKPPSIYRPNPKIKLEKNSLMRNFLVGVKDSLYK
ncbi:MAG: hypothetical protein WC243_01145 [Patescibacteria group bacterium]